MRPNLRLLENHRSFRVEARSQKIGVQAQNIFTQILRIRIFCKRMKVGNEKVAFVFTGVLQFDEIFERAEVIADVKPPRGLNAGN